MAAKKPNILVCPLDWGIGHATRCIPLIRKLKERHVNVILAADNRPLMLLRQEFPELPSIRFPGYRFTYPESSNMALKMLIQAPGIMQGIRQENHLLDQLILQYDIDAVISDNRFGLHSKRVPSIFMTHQVFIRTPERLQFLKPVLYQQNRRYISKFRECWIPDFKGAQNLSGLLSHEKPLPANYHFIGPQTRFELPDTEPGSQSLFDLLVILSGPEPQRSILENKLKQAILASGRPAVMVLGKPELLTGKIHEGNLTIFNHLDAGAMQKLILSSEIIISRPGYSTLMDLAVLRKKAIFIPTPGQTEQEYLARHCEQQKLCYRMDQGNIDLGKALTAVPSYRGLDLRHDPLLLDQRVDALLELISRRKNH